MSHHSFDTATANCTCTVAGSLDDALIGEALALLEQALAARRQNHFFAGARLTASAAQDLAEFRRTPSSSRRAWRRDATATLKKGGEKEAVQMRDIIQSQRKQLDADKRYWQPRLESLETELTTEHAPPPQLLAAPHEALCLWSRTSPQPLQQMQNKRMPSRLAP